MEKNYTFACAISVAIIDVSWWIVSLVYKKKILSNNILLKIIIKKKKKKKNKLATYSIDKLLISLCIECKSNVGGWQDKPLIKLTIHVHCRGVDTAK